MHLHVLQIQKELEKAKIDYKMLKEDYNGLNFQLLRKSEDYKNLQVENKKYIEKCAKLRSQLSYYTTDAVCS